MTRAKKKKPKLPTTTRNRAGRPLTDEEFDKVLSVDRMRASAFPILGTFFGLGFFTLCATPLARSIAGTTTHFVVQVSIAVNVTLAITTALGGVGCYGLNKARRHHKGRARELEKELVKARAVVGALETSSVK